MTSTNGLKPTTWEEWAQLNRTNRKAYALWQAADPIAQEETDPDDWCERRLVDCPMCGLTHIESHIQANIHAGTVCSCGFRTTMHVYNPKTKQMEPAVPAYIRAYLNQENSHD